MLLCDFDLCMLKSFFFIPDGADLKFDESTASRRLSLCKNNRKATVEIVSGQVKPPEKNNRFKRTQVLCDQGLDLICYWEVEWEGKVGIAVTYEGISRRLDSSGGLGCNEKSWSLICSRTECTAVHDKSAERIDVTPCSKIAAFLDWEAGTLSYYNVSSEELSLIHTFEAKFTEPVFPGFWVQRGSVTLCDI